MSKPNVWMSVSDLMTGLMVIFLFVTVSYMVKVNENQQVLVDYMDTRQDLHEKLVNKFAGDTLRWQMSIGKDLTLKFNNAEVLFPLGSAQLTPEFKEILDEFLPTYFDLLLNDSLRYQIKEIRIEGHTDTTRFRSLHKDPYIANIILSQRRALAVVEYYRESETFENYSEEDKRQIEYWLMANGLSYGKAIDSEGQYTMVSGKEIDNDRSRRVEIKVVTNGDEVIVEYLRNKNKVFGE